MDPHPRHHLGKLEEAGMTERKKKQENTNKKMYYDKSSVGWRMETDNFENEQKKTWMIQLIQKRGC